MTHRFLATLVLGLTLFSSMLPVWGDTNWLSPGPKLPAVSLRDQDGREVSLASLIKVRPVIINFFFTGCSATCPMQTAQLALLQDAMDQQAPTGPKPLILSISLDPMGDTPASITQYAANFEARLGDADNWLMLTGGFDDLRQVWNAFDQGDAAPQDHVALFWIGHPAEGRWTRVYTLADPAELYRLLMDQPS